MGIFSLLLIALGLSMDAFAVSISNGMCYRDFHKKQMLQTAFSFGLFQALMPTIGYFTGRTFSDAIAAFDHWIALFLLGSIGGKMILDGVQELRRNTDLSTGRVFTFRILLLQSIATSIDALAVGIGFAVMQVRILVAASFIGIITFFCCLFGFLLGKRFGVLLGHRAEIFGGLILVAIGLKICAEHLGLLG